MTRILALLLLSFAAFAANANAQPAPAGLSRDFSSQIMRVNGVATHYVRGGSGPAIVLLHGFPQDWFEWHKIMPQLAKRFTVVALDLPGIGRSSPTPGRYDAAAMARTVYEFLVALDLHRVYLVGHDIGGMVAHAFARDYPERLRGVMILDVPLPGLAGWNEVKSDPLFWHVAFMQQPNLPEKLILGRQAEFFDYFFALSKFSRAETARYVQAYASLAQLHAVFEMYRALPATEKANTAFAAGQPAPNPVPLFLGFGEKSPFARLMPRIAADLRAAGMARVETGTIAGAVHYLVQDNPSAVAELIERQAGTP
jgi:pimeloyl-ACP methyl ester carboxylesterase